MGEVGWVVFPVISTMGRGGVAGTQCVRLGHLEALNGSEE